MILLEVVAVVARELGDDLARARAGTTSSVLASQAGLDHRVDRGSTRLLGEHRRREERVVDVEEDRVGIAVGEWSEIENGSPRGRREDPILMPSVPAQKESITSLTSVMRRS